MSDIRNQSARALEKVFAAGNQAAAAAYTNRAMRTGNPNTATNPSTTVILADAPGKVIPGRVRVFPIATANDDDTLALRIWGWNRLGNDQPGEIIWFPYVIVEVNITLGAFVGVAGSPIPAGDRAADTITLVATTGEPTTAAATSPRGTTEVYSPANDTPAYIDLRIPGCEQLDFEFKQGGVGTPSANALLLLLAENH